ncbi:IclR family transcriptional regulator [Martelella mediterranea]|uniref:IclR family transcriptional regulator n=1 Tax=Martelella mediterranea TaxID=293089 RepID=UPI001E596DF2|nr:IclR family transcriptional regulator [Martelella mediterranea]MCD1636475.1 IclR family transcriptional regulator [Martelella mediterranea]
MDQLDIAKKTEATKPQSSIRKSIDILFLLADGETRFSRIGKQLGFGNGTTSRLLKNLMDAGMVTQDPLTKDYFLSSDILKLSARVESSYMQVAIAALAEMEALRDETHETVTLCKRIGLRKVIVEEITSHHGIKFEYGKGYSSSFHSGATGIALMTHLRPQELSMLLESGPLEAETQATVIKPNEIAARIDAARRDGYAISFGEVTVGTASVSVPLDDGSGSYALTVVGPANRFHPQAAVTAVKEAVKRIEARLRSAHG